MSCETCSIVFVVCTWSFCLCFFPDPSYYRQFVVQLGWGSRAGPCSSETESFCQVCIQTLSSLHSDLSLELQLCPQGSALIHSCGRPRQGCAMKDSLSPLHLELGIVAHCWAARGLPLSLPQFILMSILAAIALNLSDYISPASVSFLLNWGGFIISTADCQCDIQERCIVCPTLESWLYIGQVSRQLQVAKLKMWPFEDGRNESSVWNWI